jgi:hypothetical protein
LNATVPVAPAPETVAVKVTGSPKLLGFLEDARPVVVAPVPTVRVAVAPPPLPPSFELTALVELVFVPAVVPVTMMLN